MVRFSLLYSYVRNISQQYGVRLYVFIQIQFMNIEQQSKEKKIYMLHSQSPIHTHSLYSFILHFFGK